MDVPVPTSAPSNTAAGPEVAVVRQPISDARRNVVGYELVVGGEGRGAVDASSTSSLLLEAFGEIGIEQLSGTHPAWIGVSPEFLVEVGAPPVRPDRAVLQLPARVPSDELLGVLQQLTRQGYTLAVDDFEHGAGLEALLQLASIVRVDVTERSDEELRAILAWGAGSGVQMTAVGVTSNDHFARCLDLGFAYFQGPFFAKPREVRHRGVATAGVGSLRSLKELSGGGASFEDLERIIASDVGLSLKLLRYVNSAFFALPRTIGSVREALQMLGARTVQRWATVMAMSSIPDVPSELIGLALVRARMCETLGDDTASAREGSFTVGLFSVADALLGQPMEDVLEDLPFDEEIRAALLRREGAKGELLEAIVAYEHGEFPELPASLAASGKTLAGAYREALEWAESAGRVAA